MCMCSLSIYFALVHASSTATAASVSHTAVLVLSVL
jgi:hypothetical protein